MLIIDKPSGLAVQPGAGVKVCVLDVVERDFGFKPFLVHRLDRETAGCLLLARSSRAAARLSAALAASGSHKTYRAMVAGQPVPAAGTLRDPVKVRGTAMAAETRYRTLATLERFSLVEAELATGRMHQIRQHFSAAGFPVLGDERYGNFKLNKELSKTLGVRRLMLYAWRLELYLPGTAPGATNPPMICAQAALPTHFADFMARTGLGSDLHPATVPTGGSMAGQVSANGIAPGEAGHGT